MECDVLQMLEKMAPFGQAPEDGCSLFGVGYDDAFNRIKETYLRRGFARGSSSEKFIVGPFGSGKTHFLRQLMELAREEGCVTAEVQLNKDVDFTQSLIVYKELTKELVPPGSRAHGIRNLLEACTTNVKDKVEAPASKDLVLSAWISGLDKVDFKLEAFRRMVKKAFLAYSDKNYELYESICQWLGGEVDNKLLCKELGIQPVTKNELNVFAKRATLSLFQLVRHAGFKGIVVCFDEAEQGLTADRKKTEKILSMLMSGIASIVELSKGSALVVYAITPDLQEKMETFAALQQRIADPVGYSFFEGNTYAPLIRLTKRDDPLKDLEEIGNKLVEVFFRELGEEVKVEKDLVINEIQRKANEIVETNLSAGNRRDMVKAVCTMLLTLYETGALEPRVREGNKTPVEDEV